VKLTYTSIPVLRVPVPDVIQKTRRVRVGSALRVSSDEEEGPNVTEKITQESSAGTSTQKRSATKRKRSEWQLRCGPLPAILMCDITAPSPLPQATPDSPDSPDEDIFTKPLSDADADEDETERTTPPKRHRTIDVIQDDNPSIIVTRPKPRPRPTRQVPPVQLVEQVIDLTAEDELQAPPAPPPAPPALDITRSSSPLFALPNRTPNVGVPEGIFAKVN
jgi:hypothetical protein